MKPLKFLLIFSLFATICLAKTAQQIEKEISQVQSRLEKRQNDEGALQSKVDALSVEIAAANDEFDRIELALLEGEKNIKLLAAKVAGERSEFLALQKERDRLIIEKESIEKKLADLTAKHAAQSIVLNSGGDASEEDMIRAEIFYAMRDRTEKDAARLKMEFSDKVLRIRKAQNRIDELQSNLDRLVAAENRQKTVRAEQKKLLEALDRQKRGYLSQLNKLIEQKNSERQLLADLKIVRQKAVDEMRQAQLSSDEARRREAAGAQALNVKMIGASYQQAGNGDYRGKKVKAPLDSKPIVVTKEFGPYTDPIYHIKIHNDSVTLKAGGNDALVRSVLPGKVVFADDLKMLGKVVIVEHKGNIHTIYRNLESISPNIKVSSALKERESIGRVEKELVFEVTKDGLPINPLQLIAI